MQSGMSERNLNIIVQGNASQPYGKCSLHSMLTATKFKEDKMDSHNFIGFPKSWKK